MGAIWDFLNMPWGLSKKTKAELVVQSQEYQDLDDKFIELSDKFIELNDKSSRIEKDQLKLLIKNSGLKKDLKESRQENKSLEMKINYLEEAIKNERENPFLRFGKQMFANSNRGILRLDFEDKVIEVNENMLRYLGIYKDEVLDKKINEIPDVPGSFGTYTYIYSQVARHLAEKRKSLEGNVVNIRDVAFDIQGIILSQEKDKVMYDGGFIILTPFVAKKQSFLKRRFPGKGKVTIKFDHPIIRDEMVDVYLKLWELKKERTRYLDFNNFPVEYRILDSLSKFYQALKKDKKRLVFENIPENEKNYLLEKEVKIKDIQGVSKYREGEDFHFLTQET